MGDEVLPVHVTVLLPTLNEEEAIEATLDEVPRGWCRDLEILLVDGNSKDRTRELALAKGARVHIEPRRGYGRAYRTGFAIARGEIIVTLDADCTYPARDIPDLVKQLVDNEWLYFTGDRISELKDKAAMSAKHAFGNWALSFTGRMLFWKNIRDSQSGMWVFRKSIIEEHGLKLTNDGMPLSEEIKLEAFRRLPKGKAVERPIAYRQRVGDAEINTWADGFKNLRFFYLKRVGLSRTRTPWGPLPDNPDSDDGTLPEQQGGGAASAADEAE